MKWQQWRVAALSISSAAKFVDSKWWKSLSPADAALDSRLNRPGADELRAILRPEIRLTAWFVAMNSIAGHFLTHKKVNSRTWQRHLAAVDSSHADLWLLDAGTMGRSSQISALDESGPELKSESMAAVALIESVPVSLLIVRMNRPTPSASVHRMNFNFDAGFNSKVF